MNADFYTAKQYTVHVQYIGERAYEYFLQVADTKDNFHYMSLSAYQPKVAIGNVVGVLLCMCESVASVLYVYNRTIVSLHEPATPWKG